MKRAILFIWLAAVTLAPVVASVVQPQGSWLSLVLWASALPLAAVGVVVAEPPATWSIRPYLEQLRQRAAELHSQSTRTKEHS